MVYEKIRRKQERKDLLSGGLLIFLVALLCIAVIVMWVIGFRTPQNANLRDWFVLVSAVVILGVIVFIVLLLANAFLRDKDFRKRLIETLRARKEKLDSKNCSDIEQFYRTFPSCQNRIHQELFPYSRMALTTSRILTRLS